MKCLWEREIFVNSVHYSETKIAQHLSKNLVKHLAEHLTPQLTN